MNLGDIFSYPARFALKIFWFGVLALFLIMCIRVGYCVSVANTSLEVMMPQISRYVAEWNGIPIEGDDYIHESLGQLLMDTGDIKEYNTDGSVDIRPNSAFTYKLGGASCSAKNTSNRPANDDLKFDLEHSNGKDNNASIRVYIDKDGLRDYTPFMTEASDLKSDHYRVAQRGEVITIELTVWATPFGADSNFNIFGFNFNGFEYPITHKMSIPAVKYYRGLE